MPKMRCAITITEDDDGLAVHADIPDGAGETLAGALAVRLLMFAREIMNEATGEEAEFRRAQ